MCIKKNLKYKNLYLFCDKVDNFLVNNYFPYGVYEDVTDGGAL